MTDQWRIDPTSPTKSVLHGVFRLESPEAYDRAFASVLAALEASGAAGYTIDVSAVFLMNSSGIRALADLVMLARRKATPLTFVGKADVPWQAKTFASLKPLHTQLTIEWS